MGTKAVLAEPIDRQPPGTPTRSASAWRHAAGARAPLLVGAGVVLITIHLLDLAFSGPATSALGVLAILAVAGTALALQRHVSRWTVCAIAVPVGAIAAALGTAAHVLDVFTSGPRWTDVTGVGCAIGGVLLVAGGVAGVLGPWKPRPPRTRARRAAHAAAWLIGAVAIVELFLVPFLTAMVVTHAPRVSVEDAALRVPHETVHLASPAGRLAAWWVPSRNGAAVLIVHGSGGNRSRVARQAELVARAGYGVLSLDLPGHGDSDGHANLLGWNAQPAVRAAVDWLARQPGVDPRRLAGFGMSLGGEVLLEATANDGRLQAVISDGAERAGDDRELKVDGTAARALNGLATQATRAVSGMHESPPLLDVVERIAPRPVLLIAAGARPHEIQVNRAYRRVIGPSARLWALPGVGHTQGVTARPSAYRRQVLNFLRAALEG